MSYYRKIITNSNNETFIFVSDSIEACDAWKAKMILNHEIISESLDDITGDIEKQNKIEKLKVKKQFAQDVLNEINYMIDELPTNSRLALAARADIQQVLFFLNQGSIVDTKTLVQNLLVDENLTQTMKDLILSTLQAKIDLFANL